MANNELSFNQISTLLNKIVQQATGKTAITPTNTSEFVTVGQTALLCGYDPLNTAISQVLSGTIYNYRPYNRKFKGMEATALRWGNMIRELDVVDSEWEEDDRLNLTEGESLDMYEVKKPSILQTNYYGQNVYQNHVTIYRDQLDSAFNNPDEFARLIQMIMGNLSDQREQALEGLARATICNFIAGKIAAGNNVRHLVTEYNAYAGTSLTSETVRAPENWPNFVKWAYATIKTAANMMSERSELFHINVTDKPIMRHTPAQNAKLYIMAQDMNLIQTSVLTDVFNDKYMKMIDHELVTFWQSISAPSTINVKPVYMNTSGELVQPSNAVNNSHVFGVLFDEKAMGYNIGSSWMSPTPFNARGGYTNYWLHVTARYLNAFHQNGIVFLLD